MSDSSEIKTISILGGTGKEGKGLALRWAKAGYRILIGSRSDEKAVKTANEILEILKGGAFVEGMSNLKAAQAGDIVVLTVPYSAHRLMLEGVKEALVGKILVDVTSPLVPPKVTRVQMPSEGSAAMEALKVVGEKVQVASAFQNISYHCLMQEGPIDCDVLVTGTTTEARSKTLELVTAAGLTGWDAGPLENSVVSEGLTSVLININKHYGTTNAGIKIIGIKPDTI